MTAPYEHWNTKFIADKYRTPRPWSARFKSEVYFLEKFFRPGMRVLDVGCASGDLYHGLRERFGAVEYTGLDVSEGLISRARELAPGVEFVSGDIFAGVDSILPGTFDLVVATGVFQHEPRYEELLSLMLKYAKPGGLALFDIKLFHTHPTLGDIEKSYGDHGDHRVYYIINKFSDAVRFILNQPLVGSGIEVYGYYSGVNDTVRLPATVKEEVCSAHVLVRRGAGERDKQIRLELNLPEEFIMNLP
ncbi:MAG: Trans-aconitate 2-methyltransferase [Candidatus Magasanikbacteria bacterium GW2011_GWA2_56_11]|uniref:Trans-aconitate 2-methyltransferase n=1 Tax=Candidatus Magasanikbacteria bacterium GW2011_GWA2_56_11 TaxID=1619044 RepID=A0A0G2BA53_9BACT|nr:MAG: Trans-aconitate 2-methyltransferase [Candidatus Magasanikbacteria bacterium GW2011_GWA2_56_11]